jgi:hypothetical protein
MACGWGHSWWDAVSVKYPLPEFQSLERGEYWVRIKSWVVSKTTKELAEQAPV